MPPYRDSPVDGPKLTAEAGIVDDMVRQFADQYAFLRELVQNGIDAGATRIDVRLERSDDGAVRTSVEDDGCGMTRAIIEGPLLTLFESSKESDPTKIGKYGIGFVSVFALAPDRVDVRTRTASEAWVVRLFGDHSFELLNDEPRPGTGSEVILVHTMTSEAFAAHVALVQTALTRWCKHAHVPIALSVVDGFASGDAVVINVPMTVPGVASVTITSGDERFVVGAGETFCGYYNHGLTLREDTEGLEGLERIAFKIDSPKLAHTLSRDNVRRDKHLGRLLARVREIAKGPLLEALEKELEPAAEEAAQGGCERYAALVDAMLTPAYRALTDSIPVPLVDAIKGRTTMKLGEVQRAEVPLRGQDGHRGDASSPLTQALAASGRPVVRHVTLGPLLRRVVGEREVLTAEQACALASVIEAREEDEQLCRELLRLLTAAGREVASVRLAVLSGVASEVSCRVATSPLVNPADTSRRRWGPNATLYLSSEHSTIRLARRRARTDVALAAQLLCRAILVVEGPLDAGTVDSLLEAAVTGARHG